MSYPKRYDALPCETIRDDDENENAIHPTWEKEGEKEHRKRVEKVKRRKKKRSRH